MIPIDEETEYIPLFSEDEEEDLKKMNIPDVLPILPLRNTVLFPGLNGGANWGGAAFDPSTDTLFINSMDVGGLFRLVERPEVAIVPHRLRGAKYEFFCDKNRYPCQKPPWGHLTAIDLNSGKFRWRSVLGEFD